MQIIADLQLHSKYSRAVSKDMVLPSISAWIRKKGMDLVATGDWTHPLWFRDIQTNLEEYGNGLLKLKGDPNSAFFMLATEVSCIYSQSGKLRRIHTLIWVPTLESAAKINQEMTKRGCNLMSDGRPIIGLSSIHLAELVLSIEPQALIIPAHAWTPWFSVYGSLGGFDSLEEAFGTFAKYIYAVETGLSSNPAMNWRIKELDNRSIVSFSDAHSGPKLGRESTVFDMDEVSYDAIYQAITAGPDASRSQESLQSVREIKSASSISSGACSKVEPPNRRLSLASAEQAKTHLPAPRISYTIEFYPEEGKYHFSGHRNCHVRWGPEETSKKGNACPVCGKPLTQGVVQRVEELSERSEATLKLSTKPIPGTSVAGTFSETFPQRPPFIMLVPLQEIIAESVEAPVTSPKVQGPYQRLTDELGGEFDILLRQPLPAIAKIAGAPVAVGVDKVRRGDLVIDPGYDGVFGVVKLWKEGQSKPLVDASREQLSMF